LVPVVNLEGREAMTFEELERKYYELRGRQASGQLSEAKFQAAVEKLTLKDAQGHVWTIGAKTGQWFVSRGGEWVQAQPPYDASRANTSSRAPAAKKGPSTGLIIGIVALLFVLCLGSAGVGAYLYFSPSIRGVSMMDGQATSMPSPTSTAETSLPSSTPMETETPTPRPTDTPVPTDISSEMTVEEYIIQGDEMILQSKFEEGIEQYRQAIEIEPQNGIAYARWARALSFQGDLRASDEIIEQALAKAITATELDPDSADAFASLARIHDWTGQYDKAVSAGQKAIELDPNHAEAHAFLAETYLDLEEGESVQAEEKARKALELDPDSAEAHRSMGWVYWFQGREAATIREFERAAELEPEQALRHYELASWYRTFERYDRSVDKFERAIALYAGAARAHDELGWLYHDREQYDEAIPHFEEAIDIKTDYLHAYWGLGQCHFALEAYQEAIEAYQRVVELNPEADIAHTNMGWSYYYLGDNQAAQKAVDIALDINPDYGRARELAETLNPVTSTPSVPGELVLDIRTVKKVYTAGENPSIMGEVTIDGEPAPEASVCVMLIDRNGTQLFNTCDIKTIESGGIPYLSLTYGADIPSGYTGDLTLNATASYVDAEAQDTWTFTYGSAGPLDFTEPTQLETWEPVNGEYKVTIILHIQGGIPSFTIYQDGIEMGVTDSKEYALIFNARGRNIVHTVTIESADGQSVSHDYFIKAPWRE